MAWSRRDQIQANQFLRRRTISALVLAEPDSPDSPTRRPLVAALAGAVVLTLVLAGFGVYGLLRPGSAKTWRTPGTIVVQKDTGTRFVLAADGRLHPVLNYASARLIVGADRPATATVSAASLRSTPRGRPVGIVGAPDALPDARALSTGPWTACSRPATGGAPAVTSVVVGAVPPGQDPTADQGLLVRDSKDGRYLLAEGKRWAIRGQAVAAALNYSAIDPLPVADAWLDAVPAGPDLAFPAVDRRGARPRWPAPDGVLVGQVLEVTSVGTPTRFFLVLEAGVRAVDDTDAALLLGDPDSAKAYPGKAVRPVPAQAAALATAPTVAEPLGRAAFPVRPPKLLDLQNPEAVAVCVVVPVDAAPGAPARLRLSATGQLAARRPLPVAGGRREVAVPPGTGALVRTDPAGGAVFLVTDQGNRYPVPDEAARTALGYGRSRPVILPSRLVELLSAGPALDRAAAALQTDERPGP